MKIKKKGKVHPSPPLPPSISNGDDVSSVMHLLPATILALAALLSADDRHVLAYMITRSMKTAPSSSSKLNNDDRRHVFGCDCFDCYRSYWFRWDSSPNRELIHKAMEAFEDHVAAKASRKTKTSRRRQPPQKSTETEDEQVRVVELPVVVEEEELNVEVSSVSEVGRVEEEVKVEEEEEGGALNVRAAAAGSSYKGFARKVLPDVLGLFNSRLWKLWSPNA